MKGSIGIINSIFDDIIHIAVDCSEFVTTITVFDRQDVGTLKDV